MLRVSREHLNGTADLSATSLARDKVIHGEHETSIEVLLDALLLCTRRYASENSRVNSVENSDTVTGNEAIEIIWYMYVPQGGTVFCPDMHSKPPYPNSTLGSLDGM